MDDLLRTLGAPRRREILALVRRRERSAGEIHRALGDVTFGAVSQHLGVLERSGLVSARRDGRRRLYQARPEGLAPLKRWLDSMWDDALASLKRLAEDEETEPRRTGGRPGSAGGERRRRRGHDRGRRP